MFQAPRLCSVSFPDIPVNPCLCLKPGSGRGLQGAVYLDSCSLSSVPTHLIWDRNCAILADGVLWGLLQNEEDRDKQSSRGGEEKEQLQPDERMPFPADLQEGQLHLVYQQWCLKGDFLHRHSSLTLPPPSHCNSMKIQNAVWAESRVYLFF